MSTASLTLKLLEALYRSQQIEALLALGLDEGCWAGARWREPDGAVVAQVGEQAASFWRHEFSLGWLEAWPQLDESLMVAMAPFLDAWLESHWTRHCSRTLGCWVDLKEQRFASVLPTVRDVLGHSQQEFEELPVPKVWLETLGVSGQGQATLYIEGAEAQPTWLETCWTRGTRDGQVWMVARDVTNRNANAEVWQELDELGLTGNWELDLESGQGRWTAEVSRSHGVSNDCQPRAELSLHCFPESARLELEAAMAAAIRSGEPYELELPILNAHGQPRWVRASGLPLYRDGKVAKMNGMFKDITPTVVARQQLESERDRLRAILDTTPDLVWLKSPDGKFLECNARFQALLGATRDGILGKTDYDFVPPETADFFRAHDLRAMQSAEPRRNEEWVHFAEDGHRELLETIKRPLYQGGRLVGVLGIGRDLTENYNVRRRLEESQERLRMFLENAPAAVAMFDRQMRYLLVSHRFASDYGLSGDLTGRSHYEVFPELPDHWRKAHDRCLAGSLERCEEDSFTRRDGTIEWVRWETHPWYGADRGIGGLILFSEVITAAKNAEVALKISDERFRAAQRLEAIGRLAGGVAHDFNNLLTVIVSCAELVRMQLPAEHEAEADLEEILLASKRAESLTRQLLTFSRSQVVTLEALDWSGVVSGLSSMLHRLIGEDVELSFEPPSQPCWVMADRGQLEQVLMNLAVNARDAMPSGGRLALTLQPCQVRPEQAQELGLKAGDYARLRVEDTGGGMDEETRQRMFEPFFTTKSLGKGTGLGLSTVYGIVQQCEGSIEVKSEAGRGTRFDIYLPLYQALAATEEGPGSEEDPAPPIRILVIEDEAPLRTVLKRLLGSCGYEVFLAGEAEEALELARRLGGTFDLVLSDVILPGMNGCELMGHLLPLCPRARHLFMSGYTGDVLDRFDIPAERVLAKPFDRQTLTSHIQAVLDA